MAIKIGKKEVKGKGGGWGGGKEGTPGSHLGSDFDQRILWGRKKSLGKGSVRKGWCAERRRGGGGGTGTKGRFVGFLGKKYLRESAKFEETLRMGGEKPQHSEFLGQRNAAAQSARKTSRRGRLNLQQRNAGERKKNNWTAHWEATRSGGKNTWNKGDRSQKIRIEKRYEGAGQENASKSSLKREGRTTVGSRGKEVSSCSV